MINYILTSFVACYGFALLCILNRIAKSIEVIAKAQSHFNKYLQRLDNLCIPEEFIKLSSNIRQHKAESEVEE